MKRTGNWLCAGAATAVLLAFTGCRSEWVNARIQNQSGEVIHQLEVDYPSASFGANSLTPGATMQYRFQIQGSGPVKVEYSFGNGKTAHAQGPNLFDHQQGSLAIRLLPQGKTEFEANLQPAS